MTAIIGSLLCSVGGLAALVMSAVRHWRGDSPGGERAAILGVALIIMARTWVP
jgi:hypothetical protein